MRVVVYGDKLDLADELIEEFRKDAISVVRAGVDIAVRTMKDTLKRTGSRKSRPNEPPALVSGDLERSIRRGSVRMGRDKASVVGQIISTLSYEEVNSVEYGHVIPVGLVGFAKRTAKIAAGVRVLPRPFIRPAMTEVEPKIDALMREQL